MWMSLQMLEAAETGNWAGVAALRLEYQDLLRREHPANEATRQTLLVLQQQNQELLELAGHARAGIARELGQHRQTHRALNAYLVSAGTP